MIMVSSTFDHAILKLKRESYHLAGSPHAFKRGILLILLSTSHLLADIALR